MFNNHRTRNKHSILIIGLTEERIIQLREELSLPLLPFSVDEQDGYLVDIVDINKLLASTNNEHLGENSMCDSSIANLHFLNITSDTDLQRIKIDTWNGDNKFKKELSSMLAELTLPYLSADTIIHINVPHGEPHVDTNFNIPGVFNIFIWSNTSGECAGENPRILWGHELGGVYDNLKPPEEAGQCIITGEGNTVAKLINEGKSLYILFDAIHHYRKTELWILRKILLELQNILLMYHAPAFQEFVESVSSTEISEINSTKKTQIENLKINAAVSEKEVEEYREKTIVSYKNFQHFTQEVSSIEKYFEESGAKVKDELDEILAKEEIEGIYIRKNTIMVKTVPLFFQIKETSRILGRMRIGFDIDGSIERLRCHPMEELGRVYKREPYYGPNIKGTGEFISTLEHEAFQELIQRQEYAAIIDMALQLAKYVPNGTPPTLIKKWNIFQV